MADRTGIEWTDATWNPVRGCSRVSEGCRHCYAETIAARFSDVGQPYHGFAERGRAGSKWTGKVEVIWKLIELPLRWRSPKKIFVNSMSDFFHEAVDQEELATLFATMVAAHHVRRHIFQILTKRPDHMRAVLTQPQFWDHVNAAASMLVMAHTDPLNRRSDDARATCRDDYGPGNPPPGIWLGVSVENQPAADERIPLLRQTPAAKRFLSCEPTLGALDIMWPISRNPIEIAAGFLRRGMFSPGLETLRQIDWVICGGESGPDARPMHPAWVRGLRDQCTAAGVPFFFKQWGEWRPTSSVDVYCHGDKKQRQYPNADGISMLSDGRICLRDFSVGEHEKRIRSGVAHSSRAIEVDHTALADFRRSVEDPERAHDNQLAYQWMYRVGKKRADAMLDGREWREFPT